MKSIQPVRRVRIKVQLWALDLLVQRMEAKVRSRRRRIAMLTSVPVKPKGA